MINIKLTNKTAYTLIIILAILSVSLVVYAQVNKNSAWHASSQVEVTISGQGAMSLQDAIDDGYMGGETYSCHWEKSWKTYPVEGQDLSAEKIACNVGNCQFKADGQSCNPGISTCGDQGVFESCGKTNGGNDEWLYCCD